MSTLTLPANFEIVLAEPMVGTPTTSMFRVQPVEQPDTAKTPLADGQVLVTLVHISVDPYMRGMLAKQAPGASIVSGTVSRVIESRHPDYAPGDHLLAHLPWRINQIARPTAENHASHVPANVPPSTAIGVLGMPGQTAYFGLFDGAAFKAGDVVLVSGAAGAVGSLVGQLAKLNGAKKVVGVAGGPEKCKLVVEKYGFDACIDYKQYDTIAKVREQLSAISPDGYDVYFDNVGGHVTSALFDVTRPHARVLVCGQIAEYNNTKEELVPNPLIKLIYKRVTVRGFLVYDYVARFGDFFKAVVPLVLDGKIKYDETVFKGFASAPDAFVGLFSGKNTGKAVVSL